jgi:twitching motility protein PilT
MPNIDDLLARIQSESAHGMAILPDKAPEVWSPEGRRGLDMPPWPTGEITALIDRICTPEDREILRDTGQTEILFELAGLYYSCQVRAGDVLSITIEMIDAEVVRELTEGPGPSLTIRTADLEAAEAYARQPDVESDSTITDESFAIRPPVVADAGVAAPRFEGLPPVDTPQGRNAIDDYLEWMVRNQATDMHITPNWAPTLRIDNLFRRSNLEPVKPDQIRAMIFGILHTDDRKEFERERSVDLAYSLRNVGRFRMSCFHQLQGPAMSIRHIPETVPTLEELNLPPYLADLANMRAGLMLFCGPTGSGKSTTQAALVQLMNTTQARHIITLEDPIEYIHRSANCLIQQREIGVHAPTFARGLRDALREDPDVIMVGEMRDVETISLALSAAETGHLVFGTLHINTTINAVTRIADAFAEHQQSGIRAQIADCMRGVINQRLLTHAKGVGLVPIIELMKVNHAVAALIREGKLYQIVQVLTTSLGEGMWNFERSAAEALLDGKITREDAERVCPDKAVFGQILGSMQVQRARKIEEGASKMRDGSRSARK